MRNPNGYGTVAKLAGQRRRPYIVKKVVGWNDAGHPVYEIIGYTETREAGNVLLAQYNSDPWNVDTAKITLGELFELWKEKKASKLGRSSRASLLSAAKHCSNLFKEPYKKIKAYHMQECIDDCGKSASTQAQIKNLWGHLDRFALELDISSKSYSILLTCDPIPETSRERFSDEEIDLLWQHQHEPWVDTILILIYSGWRISELLALKAEDIDLNAGTMVGGVKTEAGKSRIVPIHSLILPLIKMRLESSKSHLICVEGNQISPSKFRKIWKDVIARYSINKTPHECRHTFESLLDSAGANRKCIDLMMGHKSADTGNRVYNHKTINELKFNLELVTHK